MLLSTSVTVFPVNGIYGRATLTPFHILLCYYPLRLNQLNERTLFECIDFHLSKLICLLCCMLIHENRALLSFSMVLLSSLKHLILEYAYDKHWCKSCRIFTGNIVFYGWYKSLDLLPMSERMLPKARHYSLSPCMKSPTLPYSLSSYRTQSRDSAFLHPQNKERSVVKMVILLNVKFCSLSGSWVFYHCSAKKYSCFLGQRSNLDKRNV